MLRVEHLAPKILMAVGYCGRQLARWLGWVAPVYHKEEGASPHPGAHKQSLQYGEGPFWGAGRDVEFK